MRLTSLYLDFCLCPVLVLVFSFLGLRVLGSVRDGIRWVLRSLDGIRRLFSFLVALATDLSGLVVFMTRFLDLNSGLAPGWRNYREK